jgi:hypothetical protein
MFSLLFYKVVHLGGLFIAFMGLAGLLWAVATQADKAAKRPALIFHGLGLTLALIGGFGMAARLGMMAGLPGWVHAKIALWLLLGVLPVVARRMPQYHQLLWWGIPVVGLVAAYLGVYKPF